MILNVLRDLKYFAAFFIMIIFSFSVLLGILLEIDYDKYDTLGPIAYFVIAFRTAVGDFDLDSYGNSNFKVVLWIIWMIIMIIGNVIFMNFIIAVVG